MVVEDRPLKDSWTLWVKLSPDTKSAQQDKDSYLGKPIGTFKTVGEFWRYWNNVPSPSSCFAGKGQNPKKLKTTDQTVQCYFLFRTNIEPKWEDEANKNGSEVANREDIAPEHLDIIWNESAYALIGESLDDRLEVTGIRLLDKSRPAGNARHAVNPKYRLEVWYRSCDDHSDIEDKLSDLIKDRTGKPFLFQERKRQQ
eukprot:CAMPEP_0113887772 /NCGR_PEP_ID=MMETSP0780_2-20120614/12431_1 /TAXON_ID=652834 /ORGANISM="Palpitomonas bilix" /LENGTH=198 /DNA_ID=CAMNT_0000876405 /DNA_START=179 /DNA_END=775 /DNA_ORIENTATION=+ /assembly_acc=CAM_ASM_000599